MIATDLAAARAVWIAEAGANSTEQQKRERSSFLSYRDEEGRVFDFHATRHGYITMLAKSGALPKMAQELARHSSIDLTMNHCAHLRLHDQAAAVEALPSLLNIAATSREALRATGTDLLAPPLAPPCTILAPTADSKREQLTTDGTERLGVEFAVTLGPDEGLRAVESGCEGMREGWVRGLEPPTFRSTV
jgi:hypothetical protein